MRPSILRIGRCTASTSDTVRPTRECNWLQVGGSSSERPAVKASIAESGVAQPD